MRNVYVAPAASVFGAIARYRLCLDHKHDDDNDRVDDDQMAMALGVPNGISIMACSCLSYKFVRTFPNNAS